MVFFKELPLQFCSGCTKMTASQGLCEECWTQIQFITQPICRKCGMQLPYALEVCEFCFKNKQYYSFDKLRSAIKYDKVTKKLIMKFKNYHDFSLLPIFARWLSIIIKDIHVDYIIPIPLHWIRLWWRGYNQALIISQALQKIISVPILLDVLQRNKYTFSQSFFKKSERLKNVENIFSIHNYEILRNKTIVLIDDVTTTKATFNAASRVFKSTINCNIVCLSIAQTY